VYQQAAEHYGRKQATASGYEACRTDADSRLCVTITVLAATLNQLRIFCDEEVIGWTFL